MAEAMIWKYSGIPHLRNCILRKRDTEIFEKVSIYKKVLNLMNFYFLYTYASKVYKKLAPITRERSHCIDLDSFEKSGFLRLTIY